MKVTNIWKHKIVDIRAFDIVVEKISQTVFDLCGIETSFAMTYIKLDLQ